MTPETYYKQYKPLIERFRGPVPAALFASLGAAYYQPPFLFALPPRVAARLRVSDRYAGQQFWAASRWLTELALEVRGQTGLRGWDLWRAVAVVHDPEYGAFLADRAEALLAELPYTETPLRLEPSPPDRVLQWGERGLLAVYLALGGGLAYLKRQAAAG